MLVISNLNKTYPNGVRALDGVTLKVSKGMFGLLGPNGAGKSSLMKTIATLQDPDGGSISLVEVLSDQIVTIAVDSPFFWKYRFLINMQNAYNLTLNA